MGYSIQDDTIYLDLTNGSVFPIFLTEESGRVVTRRKLGTILGVEHPGIVIGTDKDGFRWIVHHHICNKYPTIDREDVYAAGHRIDYDGREVYFSNSEIVLRALRYWWDAPQYSWIQDNCQHFVNVIVTGRRFSETIDEVSEGAILFGAIASILGIATKSKALTVVGATALFAGGTGKVVGGSGKLPQLPRMEELLGIGR